MRWIIIGAGIGGLSIGTLLAKEGVDILVLEKNEMLGGRCTSYEKNGYLVDFGPHIFTRGPNGPVGEICDRIGKKIHWNLLRDPRPIFKFPDREFEFSPKGLSTVVPKEEMNKAAELFTSLLEMPDHEIKSLDHVDLKSWVSKFTENKFIHSYIQAICAPAHGHLYDFVSAGEFVRCLRELTTDKSSAYPSGGCISIPKAYADGIEEMGGKILLGKEVSKIIIEDGKATGVETKEGEFFQSDLIISNADIKHTVLNLIGEDYLPKEYVSRVKELKYAGCGLILNLGLAKKVTDQKFMYYSPSEDADDFFRMWLPEEREVPDRVGGLIAFPTNFDPSLSPKGKQLLSWVCAVPPKQDWRRVREASLASLEDIFPGISKLIEWEEVVTPDRMKEFALEEGNAIGIAQTSDQVGEKRITQITPIENLYLAGAEAGGHGVCTELAANSALELFEILKRKFL